MRPFSLSTGVSLASGRAYEIPAITEIGVQTKKVFEKSNYNLHCFFYRYICVHYNIACIRLATPTQQTGNQFEISGLSKA